MLNKKHNQARQTASTYLESPAACYWNNTNLHVCSLKFVLVLRIIIGKWCSKSFS